MFCLYQNELVKWLSEETRDNNLMKIVQSIAITQYLSHKIFSNIREVIRFWYIFVGKQVLIGVFWIITIPQEELEEMEEAQEVQFMHSTLSNENG